RTFSRSELLVEAIERDLSGERPVQAVNLISQGLSRSFMSDEQADAYLQRVYDSEYERYQHARERRDFPTMLAAAGNVRLLRERSAQESTPSVEERVSSDDEVLLEWAEARLEADDPVTALYHLLRRSTLGDLTPETVREFIEISRSLNHGEAEERLLSVAETKGVEIPVSGEPVQVGIGDRTQRLLQGTVTVWVNRGMRIQNGVGVPERVVGSGFFVDPRGYLLTNYHVISSEVDPEYEGYSRLFIRLPGRQDQRIPARVIGYDRVFDLALLKVEIDPSYVFSLSDVRELQPGEPVLALGSPGGLDSSITSGIVSAAGRRFLQMGEAVQVDVPINPGNSGGPLILPDGQVAGVVFAGIEQFEGVNFAIPSYWIRHFFPRLYEDGEVTHSWLGLSLHERSNGLEVVYVAPGSPAETAGITAGELLVDLNGTEVRSLAAAQDLMLDTPVGGIISTRWSETAPDGSVSTTRRLLATAERPFSPVENALEREPIENLFPVLFGMDVHEVSAAPWGPDFVITQVIPGSIADESSLSVDDPFALRDWRVDQDLRAAFIQIVIKKRKAGFLESGVQLGAFLENDSFL
ncbi:MAG TPA: trypsin-like peptidase domain-containing protein, partial [Alkalispirochaeta sp.]|nr:trypsin-like peptidase domain-containing protein [Alkalispirochaeta sp.]